MESLTVTVAKLLQRHPVSVPYVLVSAFVVLLLGLHPW
jgi:hypothetical protein